MNIENDNAVLDAQRTEKSAELRSQSSRSEKVCSASKSIKAFEGSLRKQDSNSGKDEGFNSPLQKRLNFGKNDSSQSKSKEKSFFVDTMKKIKKVESPFIEKPPVIDFEDKIQVSENNLLVEGFEPISEKVDGESSIEQEKLRSHSNKIEFKVENFQVQEVIECEENHFEGELIEHQDIAAFIESKELLMEIEILNNLGENMEEEVINNKKDEFTEGLHSEEGIKISSVGFSLQIKPSWQRRKEMKIKKRKAKRLLAKKMKMKLNSINNFIDDLHLKMTHTNRKELVSELSQHFPEKKFTRLRRELKKLL